ncbi:MAG: hypothetical protein ACUVXI_01860 [bacterium]
MRVLLLKPVLDSEGGLVGKDSARWKLYSILGIVGLSAASQALPMHLLSPPLRDAVGLGSLYAIFSFGVPLGYILGWRWEVFASSAALLSVFVVVQYLMDAGGLPGYAALSYLLTWFLLWCLNREHRDRLRSAGVDFSATGRAVLYGILGGSFLAGHFLVSVVLSRGYSFLRLPGAEVVKFISFEAGLNVLANNLLYRVLVFEQFYRQGFSFWASATFSVSAVVLNRLANPTYYSAPEVLYAALFYSIVMGYTLCAVYHISNRRLIAPSIAELGISLMVNFVTGRY